LGDNHLSHVLELRDSLCGHDGEFRNGLQHHRESCNRCCDLKGRFRARGVQHGNVCSHQRDHQIQ
ncbi:hypothetical protein M9458_010831, partial [Cirrhinus mrigala]